jgi:uncharacterized protein YegL
MNADSAIQVFDNPQPRCPCALLLDTSGSMSGEPIAELNRGLKLFFDDVTADDFARFSVEVAIVTFGGGTTLKLPFTSLAGESSPANAVGELSASGDTPMGRAIDLGMNVLERQKSHYKHAGIPYYQPWMILMTDGAPTDSWQEVAQKTRSLSDSRKLVFMGIGVGSNVDMATLTAICPANRPPKLLQGLKFAEFFEWLSQSMGKVCISSPGDKVELPPTDGWAVM